VAIPGNFAGSAVQSGQAGRGRTRRLARFLWSSRAEQDILLHLWTWHFGIMPPSSPPWARARRRFEAAVERADKAAALTHARHSGAARSAEPGTRNHNPGSNGLRQTRAGGGYGFRARRFAAPRKTMNYSVGSLSKKARRNSRAPVFRSCDAQPYAASSSTTASSSASLGPRRGPLAKAASISLIASVSVMRWTAAISRASRSRAAS
jgi:hypothetical protein